MEKLHTICKNCVADHYWLHMDDHEKSFIKVMIGDFKSAVTVPEKFARNFTGQISETVKLETRNGNAYNVQVVKELNNFVLRSGWAALASAYELEEGDILVFIYNGDSHFKVWIHDPSGCEKELSCFMMNYSPHDQEKSIPQDNHTQTGKNDRLVQQCVGSSSHSRKTRKIDQFGSPSQQSTESVPSSEEIEESANSGGVQKPTKPFYYLATMRNMTSKQKASVDALGEKIQPKIPFYITAMHKASVADGSLPGGSKTWEINLDINTDGPYALSTGWLDFIHDNKLQEGDVCVFEASNSQRGVTLTFHPFNGKHCPKRPGCALSTKNPMNGAMKLGDHIVYISRVNRLNDQQKRKIIDALQAIQPEIPIFVAPIGNSNIGRTSLCIMAFNVEYAAKFLPHLDQAVRLNRPGKNIIWETKFQIKRGRHWLACGWRQFVRDNKLGIGDICLFQLMKDEEVTMMVYIIPKSAG